MDIDLGDGITCIDAEYIKERHTCFYLIEHAGLLAVVETGASGSVGILQRVLEQRGLKAEQVRYVIPTHVHLDHAGGAGAMMKACSHARLVVHPKGERHLIDPTKLIAGAKTVYGEKAFAELYGEVLPVDQARVISAEDGLQIDLGGRLLEIRHTPGHADHHFCVWDQLSRSWFSGDVFGLSYPEQRFPEGDFIIPTTTPVQADPDKLVQSVRLLERYRPERFLLTHFSEIHYSVELANLLCEQIEAYRQIAIDNRDAENRATVIEEKLSAYTLEKIDRYQHVQSLAFYHDLLALDINLNAQGLDVWLSRQAVN